MLALVLFEVRLEFHAAAGKGVEVVGLEDRRGCGTSSGCVDGRSRGCVDGVGTGTGRR